MTLTSAILFLQALVNAETQDFVEFALRLWGSKNDKIIVEIQRISGCSFSFQRTARGILRAAKGLETTHTPKPLPIPPSDPQESEEERMADLLEGIEFAKSLLSSESVDSQALGMDSLEHLARVSSSSGVVAEIIFGDKNILQKMIRFVCSCSDESPVDASTARLGRRSMAVITSCVTSLKENDKICPSTEINDRSVVCALVEHVARACDKPHHACDACNCLHVLVSAYPSVRSLLIDMNVKDALKHAQGEGEQCHALLEEHSRRLQMLISS